MNKLQKLVPRRRTRWLIGGSLVVLLYSVLTDPNGGSLTAAIIGQLATPVWAVWFSYIAIKALFDYFDGEEIVNKAAETSVGAAIVFLARAVVFAALLGLFGNQLAHADTVRTQVPTQAVQYIPVLKAEQERLWPDHPKPFLLASLVEQESCL